MRGEVEQQPRRARVAVARLADRSRVQQALPALQLVLRAGRRETAAQLTDVEMHRERDVAVPDQRQIRALPVEAGERDLGAQHVLPDRVPDRAVVELDPGALAERREAAQPVTLAVGELGPRVHGRLRRVRGEGVDAQVPADDEIVVADEADRGPLAHGRDALGRPRAVPGHVAEAPDLVDALRVDVGEHRFERGEVAVDVRDDGDANRVEVVVGRQVLGASVGPGSSMSSSSVPVVRSSATASTSSTSSNSGRSRMPSRVDHLE